MYLAQAANFDKKVVNALNKARTNPKSFIPQLKAMLTQFNGNVMKRPSGIGLRTKEGPKAVQELINFLQKQQPVGSLSWDQAMMQCSKDHVMDQGPRGTTGHTGSNGSSPSQRCSKYVKLGSSSENIQYGDTDAEGVVVQLMIDDGVANRGHRTSIFTPKYKKVSAFTGAHKGFKKMTVINYNS